MAFHGRRMYPWWHYAPMQYIEDTDTTYCARHKNKCNEGCPLRKPRRRTTPNPLSVAMPGYGDPRFGYGYGMFGTEEDMGLSGGGGGGHHHGGHRRSGGMSRYGWGAAPWWYGQSAVGPQEYTIEETTQCPLHGNKCGPDCPERVTVRRRVPVGAESYSGSFGILGEDAVLGDEVGVGQNFGVMQKQRLPFGTLSRSRRPFGTLTRCRYSDGMADSEGPYGVLSKSYTPYGTLSRQGDSGAGVLGVDAPPPPPSIVSRSGSRNAKVALGVIAAIIGGTLLLSGK